MDFTLAELALLVATGAFAAAINAAAGGGTFFTFPVLVFLGLPPTLANTTNTFGIWFGSLASIGGYWSEIRSHFRQALFFCLLAAVGSLGGSLILLATPQHIFSGMVPYLMLVAVTLFAFGRKALDWLEHRLGHSNTFSGVGRIAIWVCQLAVGVYGGFFGAGMGILMIAIFELIGIRDIHRINGMKVMIATSINLVSVVTFIIAGAIVWPAGLALTAGAIAGGYGGAWLTKQMPQKAIRRFIICYGLAISLWFLIHGA